MEQRLSWAARVAAIIVCVGWAGAALATPSPLLSNTKPVDWLLAYKFNASTAATSPTDTRRKCGAGETKHKYKLGDFSQAYAVASSTTKTLKAGSGLIGTSDQDPVGATFGAIYNGALSYVVFNDQFENAPVFPGCGEYCGAPWAHSKGVIAWDDNGDGVVLQVTTPSWPGSGGKASPRQNDGNTLGCVGRNNLLYAQHFFALKLSPADTAAVLKGAYNAGVPTLTNLDQVVHLRPGSPAALTSLAQSLGDKTPTGPKVFTATLSSGVMLISKPGALHVPPWQLVSATLGGEPLRVASWWTGTDGFPSTKAGAPGCWAPGLGTPGRVEIAVTGSWNGQPIALNGGKSPIGGNHAKIGVSLAGGQDYAIFGDMNQTGGLLNRCNDSQNPRGGLFFAVKDATLAASVRALLKGTTAADGDRTVAEGATPWTPPARRHR